MLLSNVLTLQYKPCFVILKIVKYFTKLILFNKNDFKNNLNIDLSYDNRIL